MGFLDNFRKKNINKNDDGYKKQLGEIGEKAAVKFLWKNDYRIIETNFRDDNGEVDIIAEQDDILVFVEVKTRTNLEFGTPDTAVNIIKQAHIKRVANSYLLQKNIKNRRYRFDIVSVVHNPQTGKNEIELLKNAF